MGLLLFLWLWPLLKMCLKENAFINNRLNKKTKQTYMYNKHIYMVVLPNSAVTHYSIYGVQIDISLIWKSFFFHCFTHCSPLHCFPFKTIHIKNIFIYIFTRSITISESQKLYINKYIYWYIFRFFLFSKS